MSPVSTTIACAISTFERPLDGIDKVIERVMVMNCNVIHNFVSVCSHLAKRPKKKEKPSAASGNFVYQPHKFAQVLRVARV